MVKMMATSFERPSARTAPHSAPDPAAGHCQSMPQLEPPGHSWASLGQFLVGSLLLSPGSWCTQGFVCALQEFVSPVLCKLWWLSVRFSSVAQSCPTLCDPMNHSTPGLHVHHHLLEFTQTHVHQVRDAIQPSYPRWSPSPPAPNPSQHQSLFQ